MSYTTMTYKAPSGEWAWMLLKERTLIESGGGCRSESEAEAQADELLATHVLDDELAADPVPTPRGK
ncbi:MAG: hypothetical protein ACRDRT_09485 [Pseudonocardiaceae bacterium]